MIRRFTLTALRCPTRPLLVSRVQLLQGGVSECRNKSFAAADVPARGGWRQGGLGHGQRFAPVGVPLAFAPAGRNFATRPSETGLPWST